MMARGVLVADSLQVGTTVTALRVIEVSRVEAATATSTQPAVWTLLTFEVDDSQATALAEQLSNSLAPVGGWYADFATADDRFVVFAGRIFHYQRTDEAGRAIAEEYARSIGVPEPQIDWGR
jgi:hypothetical protein